jgi:hypothetical protein
MTEGNPALVTPGEVPPAFAPWRDRLAALHARYLRVLVDWRRIQPSPDVPPDWVKPEDGCIRGTPPCAPYNGIRDQLRAALAANMTPVLVVYGTPEWAIARSPSGELSANAAGPAPYGEGGAGRGGANGEETPPGCEPAGTTAFARAPDVHAYQAFVGSLLSLVRAEGVPAAYWSPWNEPNHPAFLAPQRDRCDVEEESNAPPIYAQLARAMREVLGRTPGQLMLVGEVAGYDRPREMATGAAEMAAQLPADVVCDAAAWAQHAYVSMRGGAAADPATAATLTAVEQALDDKDCEHPLPVWITESGVGGDHACAPMRAALDAWNADPRVAAAFQYTFREDPAFRVGLADPALTALAPAYAAWAGEPCPAP